MGDDPDTDPERCDHRSMSLSMSIEEREGFLAGVHVGILSVSRPSLGPLSVPVWYSYTAGGVVTLVTGAKSVKAGLISREGRFSLCVQSEEPPYKYVSIEGPVQRIDSPVDPEERAAMAYRYLGKEFGDLYLEATAADADENCAIRMRPESWLTSDFSKQYS
jgi:nitroimidazol reductase NimA-like FMN-containing flavoprotein (pyridoxamine 5'-phosphate oxidase superfamily)